MTRPTMQQIPPHLVWTWAHDFRCAPQPAERFPWAMVVCAAIGTVLITLAAFLAIGGVVRVGVGL